MIPKRIDCKPGNDNFRALALYAADAKIVKDKGEKTLMAWHEGCMAEDYLGAMMEVEATQAMNTRTTKGKTYHLMVSFRPGDEAKLTPEIFKNIEKEMAKALGFSEHQRLCGIHKNTNNIHMHIAYNMIDTEKFNRVAPYYDYPKMHKVCREVELKYGLKIDKGFDDSKEKNVTKKNTKAETIEAQTGQQSFYNFVAARTKIILEKMKTVSNWKESHEIFLKIGLQIQSKGYGLVIKDRFGKHMVKASDIDRSLSKNQMENRFGTYIEASKEQSETIKAETKYVAAALHQHPKRDELFVQFQAEMERRREALEVIKLREIEAFNSNKNKWDTHRKNTEKYAMLTSHKRQLLQEIKAKEEAELITHRIKFAEERTTIRNEIPFTSWTKFLQHEAGQGNEIALDVLRTKKLKPEMSAVSANEKYLADLEATKLSQERQVAVLSHTGINQKHKRALLSVIKMQEIVAKETDLKNDDIKHHIGVNGTVIFSLKTGGTIRDTGKEIYFSPHDEQARFLVKHYAEMKFGRNVVLEGNLCKFVKQVEPQKDQQKKQQQAEMSR
jgi:hypothetical protein